MKIRLFAALVGCLITACVSTSTARGGLIGGTLNTLDFVDRENAYHSDGTSLALGEGLRAGDTLQGVLYINEIQTSSGTQNPPVPELHGVFDLKVQSIWGTVGGTYQELSAAQLSTFTGTAQVFYTPTDQGGGQGLLGSLGFGANTAIALYQGGSSLQNSLNTGSNTAAMDIAAAHSGMLQGSFGFDGNTLTNQGTANNGYWYSDTHFTNGGADTFASHFYDGVNAMTGPLATPPGTKISNQSLPGDNLPSGVGINNNAKFGTTFYDLTGTGNAGAIASSDPGSNRWGVSSSDPQQILPAPEPAMLGLWGASLGLCSGLGWLRRRKKTAA